MKLPYLPAWLIPRSMREQVRHIEYALGRFSQCLVNVIQRITSVLIWKHPCISLSIDLVFLAVCIYAALIYFDLWEAAWKWFTGILEFQRWILHIAHKCTRFFHWLG